MIIDKNIEVKIAKYNIEHYKNYFDIKLGDIIIINTELHLQKESNKKINVKCDICSLQRYIKFQSYNKNIFSNKNFPIYTCDKCSHVKLKDNNIQKYGVEYYSQLKSNLITKYLDIKLCNRNFKSYSKSDSKIGDIVRVPVNKLTKGTSILVKAKCSYCANIFSVNYDKYLVSLKIVNKVSCKDCKNDKRKEVIKTKYNVDNIFQLDTTKLKCKNSNLKKYGVDSYSKTSEYKDKVNATNINRYGVSSYSKTSEFKNKVVLTNINKYGVDSYSKTSEYREKCKSTSFEKYGVENVMFLDLHKNKAKIKSKNNTTNENYRKENYILSNNKNYIKYLDKNISLFSCDKGFDHTFEMTSDNYHNRLRSNIPLCTICNPIGENRSIKEKELLEYIKSIYSGEIISSYRNQLEIDIYLAEFKLGFEFNGLYFHSSKFKEKNYHLNKTDYFKIKGIMIIHIWEDDWDLRKDIIKSQINNILKINTQKIFARKCHIKEVNIKDSKKFLDDNHIQGKVNSSLKLGLYYNEELVSLMTFNHNEGRRKMELGGWNLNRFCNKTGINLVGGASELLSYFIKNYDVKRIVSYVDRNWSVMNLYEVLGFTNIEEIAPDYKYIVDGCRVHKSRYKKSKLNIELTESKQINKIYDCGKIKYEMRNV